MRQFVGIDEILPILGNPLKSWVYRRTARGHEDPIPAYRIGGRLLFDPEEIQAWVESHRVTRDDLEWAPPWLPANAERPPGTGASSSPTSGDIERLKPDVST